MAMRSNDLEAARKDYYRRIGERHMTPLWSVLKDLVTAEPRREMAVACWHFDAIRDLLYEAGELITAKEAERRALILENPAWPGQSRITHTLYAALQLILPGDVAPAHRHTQSALRFVIDGDGAFTAVDGEKTIMRRGDFVITPNWTWHDHGNESDSPMIWLDGLDIPIVYYMNASFAEQGAEERQRLTRPEGTAAAQFGSGLLPVNYTANTYSTSPIFNYSYANSREVLARLADAGDFDSCHGIKLRYAHPGTGGWAMPTIATHLQLLRGGVETAPYRSTDATVFVVVEGRGHSNIGDQRVTWGPNDLFCAPPWTWLTHHPEQETVIFSYSDRGIQEKLDLWREERGDDDG